MSLKVELKPHLPFLSPSELLQRVGAIDALAEHVSWRIAKLEEEIKRVR